jgi:transposase
MGRLNAAPPDTPLLKRLSQDQPLPTIWHVPDELWYRIEPILLYLDPPFDTGARRIDQRAALDAILYRLRTGVQWNQLPKQFPDDSSVHRTMQRWVRKGVFEAIWAHLVEVCEALGGVEFEWQAADGCLGKAAAVGTKSAPIPPTAPKGA